MGKVLIEAGASVDLVTKSGNTAMMDASRAGKVDLVNFLLEKGAAMNLETQLGRTPLMVASMYAQVR